VVLSWLVLGLSLPISRPLSFVFSRRCCLLTAVEVSPVVLVVLKEALDSEAIYSTFVGALVGIMASGSMREGVGNRTSVSISNGHRDGKAIEGLIDGAGGTGRRTTEPTQP
jgi:hypothetical protein